MRGIYILLAVVTALMVLSACPKQNQPAPNQQTPTEDQSQALSEEGE